MSLLGAFRPTFAAEGGVFWSYTRPWRLNQTRKANLRKRLREVDGVIEALASSGVSFKALELAKEMPKESELTPREKYFVFSRNHRKLVKGFHLVPHFTKVPHPRGIPKLALPNNNFRIKGK
ncbi:mitochondrial ribosomal protein L31-domain-containing protein [Hyaloraphidium curvatum]|nr:mitochondrial ribosomal protein L31-domain-containing protein [Hyaloraphidium curvatum]